MRLVENIHAQNLLDNCRKKISLFSTRLVFFLSIFFLSFFNADLNAQSATIDVNNDEVCEDGTSPIITFTGSGGTPEYTFTYTINGGSQQTTGTSNNDDFTLSVPTGTPGTFTYQLIEVTDGDGGGTTVGITGESVTITVNPTPGTPNPSSNDPLCAGEDLDLDANVTADEYSWTGPNGYTSTQQNPTRTNVTTSADGTYFLTITENGCESAAGSTDVTINPAPAAPNPSNSGPVCAGSNLSLLANVTADEYSWTETSQLRW